MQVWHPDKFPHSEKLRQRAEEQTKRINEAYYELEKSWDRTSDQDKRKTTSKDLVTQRIKREKTVSRCRMLLFVGLSALAVGATTGIPSGTTNPGIKSFTPLRPSVSETVVVGNVITIGTRPDIPPLVRASMECDVTSIRDYLRKDTKPDQLDASGVSALAWTARTNCLEGAALLIKHGADVEAKSENGFTPVVWAETHNHRGMVDHLVKAGANAPAAFWRK